ncbi:MAG TPA: chemotaxis protein CheB [Longimicrobiales bacterium]|nr:chemotaxis protein CheB [Longimicrobiales bacterium]
MTVDPTPRAPPADPAGEDVPSPMLVGIGASAGGLKALQAFVVSIPEDSGLAWVVIVHLDPDRVSRMSELLQDRASITVTQVNGDTQVEANHLYIIPPGHDIAVRGRTLVLQERGERADHAPIDLFFRTLAESHGGNAAGVVLSGTGADGTAGIRYIRQAGGITVAQLPEEAEYDGMPTSAIATGMVDLVLPSGEIPEELIRLRERPSRLEEGAADPPDSQAGLAEVFATLRARSGHDFSQYRRSTLLRRLDRRLRFNNVATLADYVPLLKASSTEGAALLQDLLISVSSFFRDPDAFEQLAAHVPVLFEGKGSADSVRVWVVGCATGEEVYSVAMVLAEYADGLPDVPRIQLFATDIDEQGYGWARAGLYSAAAVAHITPERLSRFFTRETGGYRIAKALREQVLFAGHNVLHDPPFSRIDLVSCRNLFIYLQPEAQERVLETFHFALNPGGLLFLGASESTGDAGLFSPLDAKHRLFRRTEGPHRIIPRLTTADPLHSTGNGDAPSSADAAAGKRQPFSYGALHLKMLEEYAPASVIVDERLDVVHLSETAGRFLRPGEGEPSHHVLAMTHDDLRRVLRTSLHHAFDGGSASTRRVSMEVDGAMQQVNVRVQPSSGDAAGSRRFALIMFDVIGNGATAVTGAGDGPVEQELEEELRRTRELLDSTSTAHDRTVAELQMVNEELQSINEEQRAATEELETGREEIQSINEELTTINQEHQSTIEELKRTNADLQNLIESTEIGTIFLDPGMRVRRFTPAAGELFNFMPADQGRPLSHITHRLKYEGLQADVTKVLESQERIEREVESDTGESFIVRINPYHALEGANDGAVITFFDSTAQHRVREELREAKAAAEEANLAKGTFLSTLSHEFRTPLNGILGYADLLEMEGTLTESQMQKVGRIKAGGWHLAAMIDEILSFAKLDGGHEVVEPETVDARTLASDAGALIEPAAGAKGLSFVLDLPDTPVSITTDPGKARQILINLCGNAVKYTESGEVRMRVHAEDGIVIWDVSDTGIGISPANLDRIFERFWQVDGGATRAAGGMGIGLAAAREYARLLRGDVQVTSEQGAGATFRLCLPVSFEQRACST